MRLGGKLPDGCCVYSTLKPCHMCSGLIHDSSGGTAKVFWGQDDPGSMAENTVLETTQLGSLLDGNKSHSGARGVLLGDKSSGTRTVMATQLGDRFSGQRQYRSTIDYIVSQPAVELIKGAESVLKNKHLKYTGNHLGNEYTHAVIRYLADFLAHQGIRMDTLGT